MFEPVVLVRSPTAHLQPKQKEENFPKLTIEEALQLERDLPPDERAVIPDKMIDHYNSVGQMMWKHIQQQLTETTNYKLLRNIQYLHRVNSIW